MLLPVGACQIGITDRVACVKHTVISLIYPDVRNISACVIGRVEKDQIPSLCFGQGDMLCHVVLFLCRPWHGDSSLAETPLDLSLIHI